MNAHDRDSDSPADLLNSAYAARPDAGFVSGLLEQLATELPARHPVWRSAWRTLAASVAVMCAMGATYYWLSRPVTPPVTQPQTAVVPAVAANLDRPATVSVDHLSVIPTNQLVGRSLLWVRCRLAHWDPPLAQYTVIHVIYGECPDDTITLDFSGYPGNNAESAGGSVPGRDMIIELRPLPEKLKSISNAGVKYQHLSTSYRADEAEAEILQGIADGSSYEVRAAHMDQQVIDAQLIVRAQLMQVGPGESKWKIIRVLKGEATPETLILDDQFYRQRAKAIVAAAARKQSATPTTQPIAISTARAAATQGTALQVDAETSRLIKAELTLPREAILMVDQVQAKPESIHGRLRYRSYEDVEKQNLDKLQDAIAHPDHWSRL